MWYEEFIFNIVRLPGKGPTKLDRGWRCAPPGLEMEKQRVVLSVVLWEIPAFSWLPLLGMS